MREVDAIFESESPITMWTALVDRGDDTYYFYLWNSETGGQKGDLRSCWICNRIPAPQEVDKERMNAGIAPMQPAEFVGHDPDGMDLDADKLDIVWFEEGDAAALYYDGEMIAAIPCYSRKNGFYGYSKYAVGKGPFAHELSGEALEDMTRRAERANAQWDWAESDFWPDVQQMHIDTAQKLFGEYEKYYAIDEGEFPPRAVIEGTRDGVKYEMTAGISTFRMPKTELYFEDNRDRCRIELGFACDVNGPDITEDIRTLMKAISDYPWDKDTFFAHGHSNGVDFIEGFGGIMFVSPRRVEGLPMPEYPEFRGDEIEFLWLVPLTQDEYELARDSGSEQLFRYLENNEGLHIFNGEPKFLT